MNSNMVYVIHDDIRDYFLNYSTQPVWGVSVLIPDHSENQRYKW